MRSDKELLDFFAELCRWAKEKYGPTGHPDPEQVSALWASRGGLTRGEKGRLDELIVGIAKGPEAGTLRGMPFHLANWHLPNFAFWVTLKLDHLMLHGPAHFREQAEARLAEIVGPEMAAHLCGMNNSK
jgi:hypothetical protein